MKLYILGCAVFGTMGLFGATRTPKYDARVQHENGVRFVSFSRLNEAGLDQKAEAKAIAKYVHGTKVYQNLPKALKEKLDANQENYYVVNKNRFSSDGKVKFAFLYWDNNCSIAYSALSQNDRLIVDMEDRPESLKGYVMASYEPSEPVDPKTKKPYFVISPKDQKRLSAEEKNYFTTLLDVINENYHFLTAYPLLQLDTQKFKDGEYWAKFIPAQYLVPPKSIPHPDGYQAGLKDEIQTHLGAPVYDLSDMRIDFRSSDCSWHNPYSKLAGLGNGIWGTNPMGVEFFRYAPRVTLDEMQIRVYRRQADVCFDSLERFQKGLDLEYQSRKASLSKEADIIYHQLKADVGKKVKVALSKIPERVPIIPANLSKYKRLKHHTATLGVISAE